MVYRNILKRVLDICISIILIVPVTIICIIFGILIFFEDKGSIFYCAERLGKNRKPFKMYKLRSMKINAPDIRNEDGSTFNSNNDPRLLKIGKFIRKASIDELPQILNVLKGEMSLIGPRPDLVSQGEIYDLQKKDQTRFSVLPGITGYAQCHGRNELDWDERISLDHYYVDNYSFSLDFSIFLKTIFEVLRKRGVNKDE